MILLVASNKDMASLNIKKQILRNYAFKETTEKYRQNTIYKAELNGKKVTLVTLSQEAVTAQDLPESFPEANFIVFISRHSSQTGKPTLTVHTPGNFAEAQLGGLPRTVSVSPACAMQDALKTLLYYKEKMNLQYAVSYEVTHHGPSLNVPTMFVELGSCELQWDDVKAAEVVGHAAIYAISNFAFSYKSAVIGVGGTHYNQKFTDMALDGKAFFGHMIPKYAVSKVDYEIMAQCRERTLEKVSLALLDWKGIKSEDKPALIQALEKAGLEYKKI